MENKPREFWLDRSGKCFDNIEDAERYSDYIIDSHTRLIEYAAYESLLAIIKRQQDALKFYKNYADCKMPGWIGKCHCSFCKGDDIHRETLAATKEELKKLGV